MRDTPAVPARISDALHDSATLDSTSGRSGRRPGKSPEPLDGRHATWKARPMLHVASLQRLGPDAGQCIHGPNSSWADQSESTTTMTTKGGIVGRGGGLVIWEARL